MKGAVANQGRSPDATSRLPPGTRIAIKRDTELAGMGHAARMTNPILQSFDPVADSEAQILILGSMPGHASLSAGQYYAHSRNAFWPIMGKVFGINPEWPYAERVQALQEHGIALWDVLRSCERIGSLDQSINRLSVTSNDFRTFFDQHPRLRTILFNGRAAAHYYRLNVLPSFQHPDLQLVRLSSTSPAMAGLSVAQKTEEWRLRLKPIKRVLSTPMPDRAHALPGARARDEPRPTCRASL